MHFADSQAPDPETILLENQTRRALAGVIAQLPPHYQQAIVLCHYEELSYEEISLIMQRPVNTIASYLHRARRHIKHCLEQTMGGQA